MMKVPQSVVGGNYATDHLERARHDYKRRILGITHLSYLVNRAFENYRTGEYKQVTGKVLRAWMRDFSYMLNRGVLSILVRSMLKVAR